MKRSLFIALVLLGSASASSAATLSIIPDKQFYQVGETVTLSIVGDDEGYGIIYGVLGRLLYDATKANPGTIIETPIGTGALLSGNPFQRDGIAEPFNQICLAGGTGDLLAPGGSVFSTVTLTIESLGAFDVTWEPS